MEPLVQSGLHCENIPQEEEDGKKKRLQLLPSGLVLSPPAAAAAFRPGTQPSCCSCCLQAQYSALLLQLLPSGPVLSPPAAAAAFRPSTQPSCCSGCLQAWYSALLPDAAPQTLYSKNLADSRWRSLTSQLRVQPKATAPQRAAAPRSEL
jgi:hypothetical protein